MLFSQFIVDRLQLLNRATRGYGNQISERGLYDAVAPSLGDPADFAPLVEWGLTTGLLTELSTDKGRRFSIDRNAIGPWRARANGEDPAAASARGHSERSASSFDSNDNGHAERSKRARPDKPVS